MNSKARSCPRRRVVARNVTAIILPDHTGTRFLYGAGHIDARRSEPVMYEFIEFWQDTEEVIDAVAAGFIRAKAPARARAA